MKTILDILLVEDDPDDVELLEEALQDNTISYKLKTIDEGDLVIPYLEQCKILPGIIVLDLNLLKMDGREVLKSLKTTARLRTIPVVILTTSSSKADMDYCIEAGAERYITKPLTAGKYREIIEIIVAVALQLADKE